MNKKDPLVSIVIPTKRPDVFLENCLKSLRQQSYKNTEIIIVTGKSSNDMSSITEKYKAKVFKFDPKLPKGKFDAPHRRNYGVKKSKGEYVYCVDADFELTKDVIKECVSCCLKGFDAVITPQDSFGKGIWARAKNLEKRCYFGDNTVEAPRFFRKSVWDKVGGLDESLGGGGDDWDLYQKLLDKNFKVGRVQALVRHNEGHLKLSRLSRKAFMYGKDAMRYFRKRPKNAIKSYFPIRPGYIRNWRLFLQRPLGTVALIIVRVMEYSAGLLGVVYGLIIKDEQFLEK